MASSTVHLFVILAIGMIQFAKGQGFGERPGCSDQDIGANGLYPKHCYDVLDEYGECLPDDLVWFEEECSRTVDDPGYNVLQEYQDAIDACFANPGCREIPHSW